MAYPAVFDEILRARGPIRPDVLRRWQQEIRAVTTAPDPSPTKKSTKSSEAVSA